MKRRPRTTAEKRLAILQVCGIELVRQLRTAQLPECLRSGGRDARRPRHVALARLRGRAVQSGGVPAWQRASVRPAPLAAASWRDALAFNARKFDHVRCIPDSAVHPGPATVAPRSNRRWPMRQQEYLPWRLQHYSHSHVALQGLMSSSPRSIDCRVGTNRETSVRDCLCGANRATRGPGCYAFALTVLPALSMTSTACLAADFAFS
ncbi:hypothetical protein OKW29_008094 [Paraburkholderia sp. CI3]